jgi:hypothetical protein
MADRNLNFCLIDAEFFKTTLELHCRPQTYTRQSAGGARWKVKHAIFMSRAS